MALCAVDRDIFFDTLDASIDTLKEGILSLNFINGIIPSKYFTSISELYCINISFPPLHIYDAYTSMTSQEGYMNKNQMICDPSIIELDKSSKKYQHTVHVFPLYFCHICMKKVDNERFLEFGVFPKREEKSTKKTVGLLIILLFGPLIIFPSNPLSVDECV